MFWEYLAAAFGSAVNLLGLVLGIAVGIGTAGGAGYAIFKIIKSDWNLAHKIGVPIAILGVCVLVGVFVIPFLVNL